MAKAASPVHRRAKATILKRFYKMASPIIPARQAPLGRSPASVLPVSPVLRRTVRRRGGHVFLRPMASDVEVLNDVNGELINLYRVVKHHLEEFVRQFKWALSRSAGVQVAAGHARRL